MLSCALSSCPTDPVLTAHSSPPLPFPAMQLRTLLQIGAGWVNAVTPTGWTPLMYACFNGHHECVELLLKSGEKHAFLPKPS